MAGYFMIFYLFITFLSTLSITINGESSSWFSQSKLIRKLPERETNLHFYFHDTISGKNPTAIQIAGPSGFGLTRMADEPLTEGPEPTSKLIGKAQGIYALADQKEIGLLMIFNYVFVDGPYNGSTLSVLGRNPVFHPLREMSIVGGTGVFRFAKGIAQAKTYSSNALGDAVVEYNVDVIH